MCQKIEQLEEVTDAQPATQDKKKWKNMENAIRDNFATGPTLHLTG